MTLQFSVCFGVRKSSCLVHEVFISESSNTFSNFPLNVSILPPVIFYVEIFVSSYLLFSFKIKSKSEFQNSKSEFQNSKHKNPNFKFQIRISKFKILISNLNQKSEFQSSKIPISKYKNKRSASSATLLLCFQL